MRHCPAIIPREKLRPDGYYDVEALCGETVHETDVTTCLLATCPDCKEVAERVKRGATGV